MIQSIPHHLSNMVEAVLWEARACMVAIGTGSLVFFDDVTTDGSVQGCSASAKCCKTDRMVLHSTDGKLPKTHC